MIKQKIKSMIIVTCNDLFISNGITSEDSVLIVESVCSHYRSLLLQEILEQGAKTDLAAKTETEQLAEDIKDFYEKKDGE